MTYFFVFVFFRQNDIKTNCFHIRFATPYGVSWRKNDRPVGF